jgi:hypothetical protein
MDIIHNAGPWRAMDCEIKSLAAGRYGTLKCCQLLAYWQSQGTATDDVTTSFLDVTLKCLVLSSCIGLCVNRGIQMYVLK